MNFVFEMPPTANKIWRVRKGFLPYKSKEYEDWKTAASWEIQYQRHGKQFSEPVKVSIAAKRNHASSDLDNRIKPILDALQDGGAVVNDNLVHRIEAWWIPNGEPGKVFVTVEALPKAVEASLRRAA